MSEPIPTPRTESQTEIPEYRTDVAYVRHFCKDLSPGLLRLVVALNGFTPPPLEDFDYCELGSGNGDTTTALAAAYPRARFVGVDLNPEHVAFSNGLASRGGLTNLQFLERDFEGLAEEKLPDFDFICAHGVLSWVAPAKRKAVLDIACAKLKPGGVLYVSYNAYPGWAAIEPLRRLMLDASAASPGTTLERARRGLAVAKLLSDSGAEYFASNPASRTMLATMIETGLPYVAHEYLQPHWHPMYFADVAREMAASNLHFIGQLPAYLNYRDLTIPPTLMEPFKGITDRIAFESLKDFAVNEFFRRDVYMKGPVARSETATRAYFDATSFGTLVGEAEVKREVRLPHCTLHYQSPLFDALIPAVTERCSTLADLASTPALAAFGVDRIQSALLHLVLGDQVSPMQRSTSPATRVSAEGLAHVPLPYNRMIMAQPLSIGSPVVLASPVAGTGFTLPMLQAVCVRLLTEVEPASRRGWIRSFVARQPLKLRIGERTIEDGEEQARVLSEELEQFCAKKLPKLCELGVLEPPQ